MIKRQKGRFIFLYHTQVTAQQDCLSSQARQ